MSWEWTPGCWKKLDEQMKSWPSPAVEDTESCAGTHARSSCIKWIIFAIEEDPPTISLSMDCRSAQYPRLRMHQRKVSLSCMYRQYQSEEHLKYRYGEPLALPRSPRMVTAVGEQIRSGFRLRDEGWPLWSYLPPPSVTTVLLFRDLCGNRSPVHLLVLSDIFSVVNTHTAPEDSAKQYRDEDRD